MYWCSFERYESPSTSPTSGLEGQVFVAYSGVLEYPPYLKTVSGAGHACAGYNVELKAADHPDLPGGGLQVGVVGEASVSLLEEWRDDEAT